MGRLQNVPCYARRQSHYDSNLGTLYDAINHASQGFQVQSMDEIQRGLVRRGMQFPEMLSFPEMEESNSGTFSSNNSSLNLAIAPSQKVTGCIANVYIRVVLMKSDDDAWRIHTIQGQADAVLSRGLLSLMADLLKGHLVDAVLRLDPAAITDRLGLRSSLSPGRNDGLASMLQTIQSQIQQLEQNASPKQVDSGPQSRPITITDAPSQCNANRQPTVAMLLSGGVDSSVAMNILVRNNYNVTAFYLKIWLEDELAHLGQCPWEEDFRICQAVCEQVGVPLETISLQTEYKQRVISYTVQEASNGRTPNPDIMCNSRVKFGCFYDAIDDRAFDYIATGHYAQLERDEETGVVHLKRAPDPIKDQSYFLCGLTQQQLQRVLFPIGHLQKAQVRELANEFHLPNRNRPDSQGLCFLGKVKFEEFLEAYLGNRPGDIVDAATGTVLGRHQGVWYHTVGQRKGLGKVLYPKATSMGPWYVVAKDTARDIVFCSNQYDEEDFTVSRSHFTVEGIQWIGGKPPCEGNGATTNSKLRVSMKIRHGPRLASGTLQLRSEEDGMMYGDIQLDMRDSGLAPGQYVAFYDREECLGGGVISEKHWVKFITDHIPVRNVTAVA